MTDIPELPCAPYHVDALRHVSLVELVSTAATNGKVGAWGRNDLAGTLGHNGLRRGVDRGGICHVQQHG